MAHNDGDPLWVVPMKVAVDTLQTGYPYKQASSQDKL
jgi:hypothetical protein